MLQFPSILLQSIHQRAQQSSFIGLQEAKPKVSSHSLRETDPHQWFVAATQATIFPPQPLLCLEALGWRAVAGRSYEGVTAGVMGHSAMTRINETCMANEITKQGKPERRITRYTLSKPHFRRAERGSNRTCNQTNIHNNACTDGDMAAVQPHLWCLGLLLLPVASGSWQEKTSATLSLLQGFTDKTSTVSRTE